MRDEIALSLKTALDEKEAEAKTRWQAFDAERKKAREAGVDPNDAETVKRLDDRHREYETVAADVEDLRKRLFARVDGKLASNGKRGGPSIGQEFLKRIGAGDVGMKALDGTSGGTLVGPFYDPQIRELPQRSLFVRSIIPVRPADGDKVWALRQSVATQAAAPVAAGAVKPTSVYTVERVESLVTTIAHITEPLDRALLTDHDELTAFLDGQLRLGVLLAEESQILNGNGTPPNLRGILNTSGIGSVAKGGSEPRIEALHRAITTTRLSFFEPDAIVMNPSDLEETLFEKNANGDYVAAQATEDEPGTFWGKQIISSPVIAAGTAIVGAFAQGAIVWDREEARVTFTESGALAAGATELFSRNQIVFRGEERIAFLVVRPAAFCQVTAL